MRCLQNCHHLRRRLAQHRDPARRLRPGCRRYLLLRRRLVQLLDQSDPVRHRCRRYLLLRCRLVQLPDQRDPLGHHHSLHGRVQSRDLRSLVRPLLPVAPPVR